MKLRGSNIKTLFLKPKQMNNLFKLFLLVMCMYSTNLFAQRVFIDENVSRFNATIFEETDQDAKVSWEIYMTNNLNPTIAGNWRQMVTADSAVFVFKKLDSRQAASFTYRIIEDSTRTKFKYSGSRSDFMDPITYMFVEDISEANIVICLTPNKWIANNVIYKSNKEFNTNNAHWKFVEQEGESTLKVFVTTNRDIADILVYFTDNPLEAQIR